MSRPCFCSIRSWLWTVNVCVSDIWRKFGESRTSFKDWPASISMFVQMWGVSICIIPLPVFVSFHCEYLYYSIASVWCIYQLFRAKESPSAARDGAQLYYEGKHNSASVTLKKHNKQQKTKRKHTTLCFRMINSDHIGKHNSASTTLRNTTNNTKQKGNNLLRVLEWHNSAFVTFSRHYPL